jgi:gamma-glutamylcyclotransferase (GGCT)/AIG2-like uncharacterized protein YtfP
MVGLASNAFPYVTPYPIFHVDPTHIIGELYLVSEDVLKRLDTLEGHPHHYNRTLVQIENGTEVREAFMYVMDKPDQAEEMKKATFRFVPVAGDWVAHVGSHEHCQS